MLETILTSDVTRTGLWIASWIGVTLLGVGPLAWALQQRFGGGLGEAMGYYRHRSRRGRPCERRQCFIDNLDRDIEHAEKVLRGRTLYTAGYVAAVFAPAVALGVYASFQAYLAPGAAAAFIDASDGSPTDATFTEIAGYFFVSGNFFVAVAGDDLAADIPALASLVATMNHEPAIAINPEAGVFSTLAALFKWVSGPAVLFSVFVMTEIWGGLKRMRAVLDGFRSAKDQVESQPEDKSPDEYRGLIDRVVEGAMGR